MRRWRNLGLAVVIASSLAIVGAAHADATLDADATVVDTECDAGAIDTVVVEVAYRGETPVTAHVHAWDQQQKTQYAWVPRQFVLEPGTQTYTFSAPEERARITPNVPAQVAINVGQQRTIVNWHGQSCPGGETGGR